MTQLVFEHRVLSGSFPTVPEVYKLFNLHKFKWRDLDFDTYSEEIFQNIYALYVATLWCFIDRQTRPSK